MSTLISSLQGRKVEAGDFCRLAESLLDGEADAKRKKDDQVTKSVRRVYEDKDVVVGSRVYYQYLCGHRVELFAVGLQKTTIHAVRLMTALLPTADLPALVAADRIEYWFRREGSMLHFLVQAPDNPKPFKDILAIAD